MRIFASVLCAASIAMGTSSSAWAEDPFGPWLGKYENESSQDATQGVIEHAIESGTEDLNFIKRKVARSRLKAINPPYRNVRILEDGDRLVTDFDGHRYAAPTDGSFVGAVDPEGNKIQVSYTANGNTLHARYVGDDGEKRMDFERVPGGSEIIMHVTVLSPKLKEPVRYSVRYSRK
jgi:hypothetical protein